MSFKAELYLLFSKFLKQKISAYIYPETGYNNIPPHPGENGTTYVESHGNHFCFYSSPYFDEIDV